MKIVIEIPDWIYEKFGYEYSEKCLISKITNDIILDAFCNGTPLPKGHGRLGDLDSIMNDINDSINEMTNIGISVDGQYLWAKLNDVVDNAPVIIEADKGEQG